MEDANGLYEALKPSLPFQESRLSASGYGSPKGCNSKTRPPVFLIQRYLLKYLFQKIAYALLFLRPSFRTSYFFYTITPTQGLNCRSERLGFGISVSGGITSAAPLFS